MTTQLILLMPTKNPWVNPYQRSFNSIKEQLKISLRNNVPEITDYSEGNIFIIIISILAGIAEVIHYYIDNMARETFFVSARRYSSLFKHAKLVDYHVKSAIPASVDLTLYTKDGSDLKSSIYIPAGTTFTSDDGKVWTVVAKDGIIWDKALYPKSIKVPVVQKEKVGDSSKISFGQIIDPNITIALRGIPDGKFYVEGSMILTIDGETWTLVDTFAYSGPDDKVYKVELGGDLIPLVVFGDGKFGAVPELGGSIEGEYEVTYGSSGNIASGSFSSLPSISGADLSNIAVTNFNPASGGSDYENFSMLKDHVPLSVKTLGVAITKEDFEAMAKLVGGVNKAYVEYICGKEVRVYITPDNGGVEASRALLDAVEAQLNKAKVITTTISVLPVYPAYLYLDLEVFGKISFASLDIKDQIVKALEESYGYNNAELGRAVRVSDVYSLIDNLSTVDYLNIKRMYILPQPILVSSESSDKASPNLEITSFVQNSYTSDSEFTDAYIGILEKGYTLTVGSRTFNGTYGEALRIKLTEFDFTITIALGMYNPGDRYYFYIGRMNTNLASKSDSSYKTIPIFKNTSDSLILNIHEQV